MHIVLSTGDLTLLICPGIGNSSKEKYTQCFINYAQSHGYRVVCMNHLGAIRTMKITASRIYTYGKTGKCTIPLVLHLNALCTAYI